MTGPLDKLMLSVLCNRWPCLCRPTLGLLWMYNVDVISCHKNLAQACTSQLKRKKTKLLYNTLLKITNIPVRKKTKL